MQQLRKKWQHIVITLCVAYMGGLLATMLHIPLPWTLGPLSTTIIMNLIGQPVMIVAHGRRVGQFIIGMSLGLYFIPEMVAQIAAQWLLLVLGALGCIIISLLMVRLNRGIHASKATVFFACMPGGASEMVNLSRSFDADPAFVASAHSLRVVLLVLIIPFSISLIHPSTSQVIAAEDGTEFRVLLRAVPCALLGVFFWHRLRQPNPWVLGSLFATAVLAYLGAGYAQIPYVFLAGAQLLLAVSLAQPMTKQFFRQAPRFLWHIVVTTLLSFVLTMVLSVLLAYVLQQNSLTIYLGMAPGGISELSLTAKALGLNVAIVSSMQTLRLIIVMLWSKALFRLSQHRF